MNTPTIAPSPSLADGFNGARDAATLARYDWDKEIGSVHVQSVTATRLLLKRAGVRIPKVGGFVAVAVRWNVKFKRLELAPVA